MQEILENKSKGVGFTKKRRKKMTIYEMPRVFEKDECQM